MGRGTPRCRSPGARIILTRQQPPSPGDPRGDYSMTTGRTRRFGHVASSVLAWLQRFPPPPGLPPALDLRELRLQVGDLFDHFGRGLLYPEPTFRTTA
jgi:hypothetical protein